MAKLPRRRCKNPDCREWFIPPYQNHTWCSPECGTIIALAKREKDRQKVSQEKERQKTKTVRQEKIKLRARKLSLQPLSYFHKQTQAAFNEFIRARDAGQPCISCGRNTGAKMNAGHYRTVGASKETRYDENNCHLQCEHCNSYLSGNIGEYKPRLIAKIGQAAFDRLMGPHELRKWTREGLQELASHYRNKTRALNKQREAA